LWTGAKAYSGWTDDNADAKARYNQPDHIAGHANFEIKGRRVLPHDGQDLIWKKILQLQAEGAHCKVTLEDVYESLFPRPTSLPI
jgi:hypothetical protein